MRPGGGRVADVGTRRSLAEGIRRRHTKGCAGARVGGRCSCKAGYEASVYDSAGTKLRKTFPTLDAAKNWRVDALSGRRKGTLRPAVPTTLRQAGAELIAGMRSGLVRNRSGDTFKPSVVRSYESSLRLYLLDDLGAVKLSDIDRPTVQRLADELLAAGRDPSTIRNALMPLRVIFRRAIEDGLVVVDPCRGLRLPAVRGRRERIAPPDEAAVYLAAIRASDRALWASALYAGLRRGELLALRWEDVNLGGGIIHVRRSYDPKARQMIEPKSAAGVRTVPVAAVLREHLVEHRLRCTWKDGLVFGRSASMPFQPSSLAERAAVDLAKLNVERVKAELPALSPLGLHECRHTFASLMIAAGVNAKALSRYMGHASITITLDRYGHLMPGNEDEAAALLDAYLARADTAARLAVVEAGKRPKPSAPAS